MNKILNRWIRLCKIFHRVHTLIFTRAHIPRKHMSSTSATALLATVAVGAGALAAWSTYRLAAARNSRVLVLVSGTLQDGFPLRANLDSPGAPAEFVGWALVRGVKMYLDPKPEGCREWVDPRVNGAQQRVNPALVCTGKRERKREGGKVVVFFHFLGSARCVTQPGGLHAAHVNLARAHSERLMYRARVSHRVSFVCCLRCLR